MASKDSEELKTNERYPLGGYSFRIERSSVPGSTNDKIEAICTDKDGKNARKSIQVPSSAKMLGWYVEANETEASVYVKLEGQELDTGDVPVPVPASASMSDGPYGGAYGTRTASWTVNGGVGTGQVVNGKTKIHLMAAGSSGGSWQWTDSAGETGSGGINSQFTFQGKTVYYHVWTNTFQFATTVSPSTTGDLVGHAAAVAWTMIYGVPDKDSEDKLVGRFAIDAEDAGGVGPGSDWIDPEDGGDPTYTLYVEVTGALSGRHNDPIEDPSYSYIPADKATVKDYGCGGDGGHGGGGGAGASTVVVHKFATNQAGNKEITAIARRHGYGSGGGKGGKGGDGCILVYY